MNRQPSLHRPSMQAHKVSFPHPVTPVFGKVEPFFLLQWYKLYPAASYADRFLT